jgi:hypothetical protein
MQQLCGGFGFDLRVESEQQPPLGGLWLYLTRAKNE